MLREVCRNTTVKSLKTNQLTDKNKKSKIPLYWLTSPTKDFLKYISCSDSAEFQFYYMFRSYLLKQS